MFLEIFAHVQLFFALLIAVLVSSAPSERRIQNFCPNIDAIVSEPSLDCLEMRPFSSSIMSGKKRSMRYESNYIQHGHCDHNSV